MITSWLLIVYLQVGIRVMVMPDVMTCFARSHLEFHMDPENIVVTSCYESTGYLV